MKSLVDFIQEALNESKEVTFLTASANDSRANTNWIEGEQVLIMKYDEHHYWATLWGITTIKKVNKSSMVIDTDNKYVNKFDKNGILKKHTNNKYLGKYDTYWVLYNTDLIDNSKDIEELLDKGNTWGFHFVKDEDKKNFAKKLKEFKNKS